MYPGCHRDVTHWFQTTCSEAQRLVAQLAQPRASALF